MSTRRADESTRTLPPRSRASRCGLFLRLPGRVPLPLSRAAPTIIGSARECDVVLDDPYVSKHHAKIDCTDGRHHVEDLGSTNGTMVDGVGIRWAWIAPGTKLRVGYVTAELTSLGHEGEEESATREEGEQCADAPPRLLLGDSTPMRTLRQQLGRLAPLPHAVLLRGETGTGKELAARTLHLLSRRAKGPFVAVNCGAIPEGLAESELFGHVKGAFTGAVRDRAGAFQRAHGGTLFLDELGELPLPLQAKLLRVLERGIVTPVGDELERPVDVRVISATHRDLRAMIEAGTLREDLYHRLGVLELWLPPLRERPDDIAELLEHFTRQLAVELRHPVELDGEALRAAVSYPWPGNVRALRNALTRAAALSDGPIRAATLLAASSASAEAGPSASNASSIVLPRGDYASMNRALLDRIIAEEGSIRRAARALAIPRSTLASWLRPDPHARGRRRDP